MKPGDFLLAALPQADGRVKLRHGLCLCEVPPFGDLLVAGVSTQLQQAVPGLDELLIQSDPDFVPTGLKRASIIRLAYLATLPPIAFRGWLGEIPLSRLKAMHKRLADFFGTLQLDDESSA